MLSRAQERYTKHGWLLQEHANDTLAERSKAVAQGAIPKGRGFEPNRCHFLGLRRDFCLVTLASANKPQGQPEAIETLPAALAPPCANASLSPSFSSALMFRLLLRDSSNCHYRNCEFCASSWLTTEIENPVQRCLAQYTNEESSTKILCSVVKLRI